MKIDVVECSYEQLNENCKGMTCFNLASHMHKAISPYPGICGVVIIDGKAIKFSFSCLGCDGDIFTDDNHLVTFIKSFIPQYAYLKYKGLKKK